MRILLDTNVVLDVLIAREPFVVHAQAVFALVDAGRVTGVLGATTLTTVFHLAARAVGQAAARELVRSLVAMFDVAPVDRPVLERALDAGLEDFEDGVLHEAAVAAGVDALVTRDARGFGTATLPAFTPDVFLVAIGGATPP